MELTNINELTPEQADSLSAIEIHSGSCYLLLYDPEIIPMVSVLTLARNISESTGKACVFSRDGVRLIRVDDPK
jgi:hypothetical protein